MEVNASRSTTELDTGVACSDVKSPGQGPGPAPEGEPWRFFGLRCGPSWGAGLDAGDLEVGVHLHGDVGAVALGHVRLRAGALGVVLDPLDGAARPRRQGGGL